MEEQPVAVHVRFQIVRFPSCAFRTHVPRRTDVLRHVEGCVFEIDTVASSPWTRRLGNETRDIEIEHLEGPVSIEPDVVGFQIPMDDVLRVQVRDGIRQLDRDI